MLQSTTFAPAFKRERRTRNDERGNLWKGDEVRSSKQNSNRRSGSKKTLNFSSEKFGS